MAIHAPDEVSPDLISRMRDGVRGWVRFAAHHGRLGADGMRLTAHQAGRAAPAALLAGLCASSVAPVVLAMSGAPESAGVTALAGLGTNILSEMIVRGADAWRARDGAGPEQVEGELAAEIEAALAEGGERAARLREEIATVLERIDASGAAMEAALQESEHRVRDLVAELFAQLERHYGEFGFLMSGIRTSVAELQRAVHRQEAENRATRQHNRETLLRLSLLQDTLSVVERRVRIAGGNAAGPTGGARAGGRAEEAAGQAEEAGSAALTWQGGSPYRGLLPFQQDDADIFYGRETMTAALVATLAERLSGSGTLVVTGASGAGKSSLLRAGLLPHLARAGLAGTRGSRRWPRLVITPTADPLSELAVHLAALTGADPLTLAERLATRPDQVHLLIRQAVLGHAPAGGRLVLVVDQFEEVFTLTSQTPGQDAPARREAFLRALHAAATTPPDHPAALVVLGVRADFWSRCATHPLLTDACRAEPFLVGPMTEAELRRAIVGPARHAGLLIEDGLIDTVMSDLRSRRPGRGEGTEVGTTPLLSQAMLATWENREGDRLTRHGYGRGGGVAGAVEHAAEAAYASLATGARAVARQVFQCLTTITQDGRAIRRPATRQELHAGQPPETVDAVLDAFTRCRLTVAHGETFEPAHDVLLQAWPRLRGWLQSDQEHRILYGRLREDAGDWDRNQRGQAFLYRGARLAVVHEARAHWQAHPLRHPPLTPVMSAFVAASDRAAESELAAARRRRRIARSGVAALTLTSILAVAAATAALVNSRAVQERESEILARLVMTRSKTMSGTDPVMAGLLSRAAWRISGIPQARQGMLAALSTGVHAVLGGHGGRATTAVFAPDGKVLASGDDHGDIRLWDVATGRLLAGPVRAHVKTVMEDESRLSRTVRTLVFGPGGRTLASGGDDGFVRLWEVSSLRPAGPPFGGVAGAASAPGGVASLAFSPRGELLAVADGKDSVRLWDVARRRPSGRPFTGHHVPADRLAFDPAGRVLATSDSDRVRLWDVRSGRPLRAQPSLGVEYADGLAFSPDGKYLATANGQPDVSFWSTTTWRKTGVLNEPHDSAILDARFSADGRLLATVDAMGARLWDMSTLGLVNGPFHGHTELAEGMALSPDGKMVASVGDTTVRLWDAAVRGRIGAPVEAHPDSMVTGAAFSPDGKVLATGDAQGKVQLRDARTLRVIAAPIATDAVHVTGVAFSPDGSTLAIADLMGDVRLWDVAARRFSGPPLKAGGVWSVAFSPDGKVLATGDDESFVRLWDVGARRELGRPVKVDVHSVRGLAFSPDGEFLAAGGDTGAELWHVAGRRPVGEPFEDVSGVRGVAFSPDGRTLAIATSDGTRLWDVATRDAIGGALGSDAGAAAFSPDGKVLAIGDSQGKVQLWNVATPADPGAAMCAAAGRSLTEQEWRRYLPERPFQPICP